MSKIIVWNCFGAGGRCFQWLLGFMVRTYKPSILVLLETRIPSSRALALRNKLGFPCMEIIEADGFRGGIWMFWDDSVITVTPTTRNNQFLHSQVTMIGGLLNGISFDLCVVYVRPQFINKNRFMSDMRMLKNSIPGPCLIAGDFNMIKAANEKSGGSRCTISRCGPFLAWIDDLNLVDLDFVGPPFTWFRGQTPRTKVACRLDRALGCLLWRHLFPEAIVRHLPRVNSDHVPIMIDLKCSVNVGSTAAPFRFQAAWLHHPNFINFFQNAWSRNESMVEGLQETAENLQLWNKDVFGNILYRKRNLLARLGGVQKLLAQHGGGGLFKLERKLINELNAVLLQEEILWYQKSRVNWILFGDKNTKFFHSSTLIRRRRNKIEGLQGDDGVWVWDSMQLMEMAHNFYINLFSADGGIQQRLHTGCSFPSWQPGALDSIGSPFTDVEVKKAIFSMAPLKAPGPDGFQAIVY
ncbi:hypothetical protein M5689_005873 [Euphorbia peplus]|nr:hypothetical protein M5689_005873 [Euphorbia peplus]